MGGRIIRLNGRTGTFIDEFVTLDSGGLRHPAAHVFGPDGNGGLDLYVSNEGPANILRYDGATGAFKDAFVAGGSGGLSLPNGVAFGPDGNLYVASFGSASVMRYQGLSGTSPGAPLPAGGNAGANFIAAGSGGMLYPTGILFGPDGNGDGHQDLYVASADPTNIQGKLGNVKRFDGVTGAFIDTFVESRSGGLDDPSLMTFTKTDPVTLAYDGGENLTASTIAVKSMHETLAASTVQPLLAEAIARWQSAGADISGLDSIDVRISDLPRALLGKATPNTIWIDRSAAGRGWFVDQTPWDDSEFTRPGNQSEQHRVDLLTVIMHELGHVLGLDHDDHGVMAETLAAGVRRTGFEHDEVVRVGQVLGQAGDEHDFAWLGAWLSEHFDLIYGRAKRGR